MAGTLADLREAPVGGLMDPNSPESKMIAAANLERQFAKAAGNVYRDAGKFEQSWNPLKQVAGIFIDNANIDLDSTIKNSSLALNFKAIEKGLEATDPQSAKNFGRFAKVILKHPELSQGADAMLKDEGANMISAMQDMLLGDGKMDVAQFEKMMENPLQRKMVASVFQKVGTSALGAEYTVRFAKDAMDAANNPDDAKKREKFLETAKVGGIDTTDLQKQEGMKMMKDFWNNPDKMIVGMLDKMNLPPELKNSLTGILSGLAGFMKEIVGHYAFGDGQQPGIVQIAQTAYDNSQISGARLRREHGSIDPVEPVPQPLRPSSMMGPT